jgi:hypothetical protein
MSGVCPPQGDAAACPMLGNEPAWVGCTRTIPGTNTASFASCTCFATTTGGTAWACETSDAALPSEDASGTDDAGQPCGP